MDMAINIIFGTLGTLSGLGAVSLALWLQGIHTKPTDAIADAIMKITPPQRWE